MSLTINHNLMAINTARNLSTHYGSLGVSTRRMSSGLRIGAAADDAAGLAVREIMRADIASLSQGVRNANDAISMIQVADGALQVIDEKLIRMKELATQAATGTYTSDQRVIIDAEFQAMKSEIQRIAESTEFNGIKLLNASKTIDIQFGAKNEKNTHSYPVNITSSTVQSLGLIGDGTVTTTETTTSTSIIPAISDLINNGDSLQDFPSGIVSFALIPSGSQNIQLHAFDYGADDTFQIFTTSGLHVLGTTAGDYVWTSNGVNSNDDFNSNVLTTSNGFTSTANYDASQINGIGSNVSFNISPPYNQFSVNGMNFSYSGTGNPSNLNEYVTIDNTTEDLVVLVVGNGIFSIQGTWDYMPPAGTVTTTTTTTSVANENLSISTQELAQLALNKITDAIIYKDKIRASLGATQNRLENTITNLEIQAENLQAAESRISDADMAKEMTEFVKSQILTQSATAMLAQANTLPEMALQLIQGQS